MSRQTSERSSRHIRRDMAESSLAFPIKLYHMLEDANNNHIIRWLPHGLSFCIFDMKKFIEELLPHYFKRNKIF